MSEEKNQSIPQELSEKELKEVSAGGTNTSTKPTMSAFTINKTTDVSSTRNIE